MKISKNISIICKWKINNPLFSPENLNLITLEEGSVGRALAFMFPKESKVTWWIFSAPLSELKLGRFSRITAISSLVWQDKSIVV